jgi:hypothetical protein
MKMAHCIDKAVSDNPLLVIGSGSSCGAGLPSMGALSEYLKANITLISQEDRDVWGRIRELLDEDVDLETALQSEPAIPSQLSSLIVEQTWACIAKEEKKTMIDISSGNDICGFVRYFRRYLHTKNKVLNVVTTNYDQIIEFSAAMAGLQTWDGFNTGLVSLPIPYSEFHSRLTEIRLRGRVPTRDIISHVKVYKPHGSLCWFKTKDRGFVNLSNIGFSDLPLLRECNLDPVIVTPGIGKYLETHQQPYNDILAEMNHSIQETKSVIFYGFGFNDIHIQGSFTSLLRDISITKIVISKKLSDSFLALISEEKIRNYLAIEESELGSRIISDTVDETDLDFDCWSFKGLLNVAWGEE